MKTMLLLGLKPGQTAEEFKADYIEKHAKLLAANPAVEHLTANILCEPTQEMIDAGWGWGGKDDSGVLAIDEIWTETDDVLSLYDDVNVIGAYETNQVILRDCVAQWPLGTKSHWVKRMGLLKCFDEQRPRISSSTGSISTHPRHSTTTSVRVSTSRTTLLSASSPLP